MTLRRPTIDHSVPIRSFRAQTTIVSWDEKTHLRRSFRNRISERRRERYEATREGNFLKYPPLRGPREECRNTARGTYHHCGIVDAVALYFGRWYYYSSIPARNDRDGSNLRRDRARNFFRARAQVVYRRPWRIVKRFLFISPWKPTDALLDNKTPNFPSCRTEFPSGMAHIYAEEPAACVCCIYWLIDRVYCSLPISYIHITANAGNACFRGYLMFSYASHNCYIVNRSILCYIVRNTWSHIWYR